MKILIPRDAVAIAIDYKGDAKMINAVRYYPEDNRVIPQFQLNTNPASKDFGQWRQVGLVRTNANAQAFIADRSNKAKRMWVVTSDKRFVDIWNSAFGPVTADQVQLEPVQPHPGDEELSSSIGEKD